MGKNNSIKKKPFNLNEYDENLVIAILKDTVFIEEEFFYEKFKTEKETNIKEIHFLNKLFDITNSNGS